MESPSGRVCDEITKRRRAAIASTIGVVSGLIVIGIAAAARAGRPIGRPDLLENLLDPILARDRFVIHELEIGHAPEPQPRADLAAKKRRRALERARRVAAVVV